MRLDKLFSRIKSPCCSYIYIPIIFGIFIFTYQSHIYKHIYMYTHTHTCVCVCTIHLQWGRPGFNPCVGKIPWRKVWQPTPVFLPGESHGQRSLAGQSLQGHKELDMTEQLSTCVCVCVCVCKFSDLTIVHLIVCTEVIFSYHFWLFL